jgi:crotonobetainyl-CoA:carnitine CoA-transferase CaiB-like acyl-CoA transferase
MLPLRGVKIIEFCQVASGPFCGMLLADMGADVVKVEPPEGDALRQWPPLSSGYSENFAALNRNKRSVLCDLKSDAGRQAAFALVLASDGVVENNRPGVMDRLGLGFAAFETARPNLVYCSISACGQTGPRARQGGFDLTIQALSGIMSVTGEPDGAPVKCGVPIADFAAGLYGAYAIAAMIAHVRAGGRGGHIDVPMQGAGLAIAALQTSEYFGTGRDPVKLGSAHPRNAPYRAFRAADGHFVVAAGNNKLWQSVCTVMNRPDLLEDPRFSTTAGRAANQAALAEILAPEFACIPLDEILERLEAAGVPSSRICTYSEALADPQVAHAGWIEDITLPSGVATRTFGTPISIDGHREPIRRNPPALGQHTEDVFSAATSAPD